MSNLQRKIMILGGNMAQVPLIEAAKKENYYVVLVDYTTTNPGIALADKHYQVNFMDREKVLEIGQMEHVQGVISNSEAAMTVVAYISEQMGLVGNKLESILKLSSKIGFRVLQKEIGLFAPSHVVTGSFEEACQEIDKLTFPVIIKPSQSSGSRGTTKVADRENFLNCRKDWEACSRFSLDDRVVLEEFVESQTPDSTVDGDVFVCNGRILWNGLFTTRRSLKAAMVPMMAVFPIILNDERIAQVKSDIERIFHGAGITFGQYNVESYYTKDNKLFFIEINPRQGGGGMPVMVQKHSGIDMYKLLVTTAMGDNTYFEEVSGRKNCCNYVVRHHVFSRTDGIFEEFYIGPELRPFVRDVYIDVKPGDVVRNGSFAGDSLGWVDLEFETRAQQLGFLKTIEEDIYPLLKSE